MIFRGLRRRRVVSWALVAVSSIAARELVGEEPSRKIEISYPQNQQSGADLSPLPAHNDKLKTLDSDLFKGFQPFSVDHSSVDGVLLPPPRSSGRAVIQSKKVKEMLERQKDWVFMSPEEMTTGPTAEEIFGLREFDADGQEKEKLSPIERFLKKLDKNNNPDAKRSARKEEAALKELNAMSKPAEAEGPAEVLASEKKIRDFFEAEAAAKPKAPAGASVFSDIFGLDKGAAPEQTPVDRDRTRKSWDELYGSQSSSVSGSDPFKSLTTLGDMPSPLVRPASALDAWPSAGQPAGVSSWGGGFNPASPAVVPDLSPKTWNVTPAVAPPPPRYEPPKPPTPASVFDFPRRTM
jgi:hypothetical protein